MKKSLMRYLFTWVFFFLTTLDCLVSYGPRCEKNCFWVVVGGGGGGGGGCFDKECFKPVSSAKETSLKIEISPAARGGKFKIRQRTRIRLKSLVHFFRGINLLFTGTTSCLVSNCSLEASP